MKPELDFRYVQVWNVPPDVASAELGPFFGVYKLRTAYRIAWF